MGFIGCHRQRSNKILEKAQSWILQELGITWDDLTYAGVGGDAFPPEFQLAGPEQEFYVSEDVSGLKNSPETIETDAGTGQKDVTVTADAGTHQLEINFPPIDSFTGYRNLLREVEEHTQRDIYCIGEKAGSATFADWIDNPRYTALQEAFAHEAPDTYEDVANIARAYALHFHFDYDAFESRDGLRLLNTFNNIGPLLESVFNHAVGTVPHRNRRYWRGWADPRRLPADRWFDSSEMLKETVMSIPQLIRVRDEGGWCVHLTPPTNWNPAHAGTIYYLARPTSENRVELRVFASMVPEMCVFALRIAMYYGIKALRRKDGDIPYLSKERWSRLF
jgi:hypothetical protein